MDMRTIGRIGRIEAISPVSRIGSVSPVERIESINRIKEVYQANLRKLIERPRRPNHIIVVRDKRMGKYVNILIDDPIDIYTRSMLC